MVLTIDGVPIRLLQQFIDEGVTPNLQKLVNGTGMRQMRSVHPTVSSVAWAGYMTGQNPGKHGIYGFIDRREGS